MFLRHSAVTLAASPNWGLDMAYYRGVARPLTCELVSLVGGREEYVERRSFKWNEPGFDFENDDRHLITCR